jgi:hypothetical protein
MVKESSNTSLAVIKNDISYIKEEIKEIKALIQEHYVTRAEFDPVKKTVYGLITLFVIAVITAILKLVII